MVARFLAAGTLLITAASTAADLSACGDKFLMPSRGATFAQAYHASHPGSIVIYAPGGDAKDWRGTRLQAALTQAGHHVSVAQNATQITELITAARVDIVLANLSEAAVVPQAGNRPTKPLVLPVMQKGNKAETDICKQMYACQLKSEDRPERFLVTINAAMTSRAKALQTLKSSSDH